MKRKPVEIIKNNVPFFNLTKKENLVFSKISENIMCQIIASRNDNYYNYLIEQISDFMKKNDITTCFILNKEELIDCLNEHHKLHQKWQKLKEWIEKDHDWNLKRGNNDCALGQRWVLDKMQELEGEDVKD